MAKKRNTIIIGAGPAGLTAAYELLKQSNIEPIVFEASDVIGGIAKTVVHKGNRMDMGGHRFFSKSEKVMDWWLSIMPLQGAPARDDLFLGRVVKCSKKRGAPNPEKKDAVMLQRTRLSRIFSFRKFFDYPISLNWNTIKNLGVIRIFKIGMSYLWIRLFPIKEEKSLSDFLINRFGRQLYNTFFKDYTKKVWGVSPDQIKPDWGSQRIKGVSIGKVLKHAVSNIYSRKQRSLSQKDVETSLIGQFIYPKYGPGQFWEQVAQRIQKKGSKVYFDHKVIGLAHEKNKITSVKILNTKTKKIKTVKADYVISTMPVRDLIQTLSPNAPSKVRKVAQGLVYRDFITIGLLMNKLKIKNKTNIKSVNNIIPDLWIYIQESDVKLGRLQVFNNWSPYMVKDLDETVWLGLEYFCTEGDSLWNMKNSDFIQMAIDELAKINIIARDDVLDSCLVRVPKAYPAYFGTYDQFSVIQKYCNKIENLFLIGRNGMHRYNNMDHSMLSAMTAVNNIVNGKVDKDAIWKINAEDEYHEQKEGKQER